VDVGAGMRPDLTGQGRGADFLAQAFRFVQSQVGQRSLRVTVASWNKRALSTVQRLGFVPVATFQNPLGRAFTVLVRPPGPT
ncbi:MAG: GNAT family protein, partial [Anaerolineae bacterium]|nr:GNAT family protein [Anaerolineae bacterium]